jgi:hypothetical protein
VVYADKEILKTLGDTVTQVTYTIIMSYFAVTILMALSLQHLIGIMNTLQIVFFMCLANLEFSSNAVYLNNVLI